MVGPQPPPIRPLPSQPDRAAEHGKSGFDRQLARLYGDSLFGPWLDPGQYLAATRTTRRHGSPFRRLAILAMVLCIGTAAGWLGRAGLARRGSEEREHVARSLATFLREGELERVAQFLALLRGPNATLDPHDPHLDLIVRAEAAVYRYQDADPARLARIKPFLSSGATGPASAQRTLASLALASRQERDARLAELESIRSTCDRDPEFYYLLATAFEHKGDVKAAQRAWDRSFDLGPLWLSHRYEHAWFESRQGKPEAVSKLVKNLTGVAPDSAWTRLVSERFGGGREAESGVATAAFPASTPAVAQFHRQFALALADAQSSDVAATRRLLGQAISAVNGQAAFVFDAFDWLVAAKATGLARDLTAFEAWPPHSELAAERVRRLDQPDSRPDDNPPAASRSQASSRKQVKKPARGKAKARRRK